MIGQHFLSFLVLLVAGLIAALVIHFATRYRCLKGFDGFLGQWVTGWIGAWLGCPVLGHWFEGASLAGIYIVPALLGAFVGAFIATAAAKVISQAGAPTSN